MKWSHEHAKFCSNGAFRLTSSCVASEARVSRGLAAKPEGRRRCCEAQYQALNEAHSVPQAGGDLVGDPA